MEHLDGARQTASCSCGGLPADEPLPSCETGGVTDRQADEVSLCIEEADFGARMAELAVFNTDVRLYAYPSDDADAGDPGVRARLDAALRAAGDRCVFFEHVLSRTRPDSDIARAHAVAPQPVSVAPETAELIRLALGYGAASEGLFDITMGTVTSLWDFHTGHVPDGCALAHALAHVGAERIRVEDRSAAGLPNSAPARPAAGRPAPEDASRFNGVSTSALEPRPTLVITDPETILDLGGIAKGYIADQLALLFDAFGVERYVINLGGNVLVHGGRPADPTARPQHRAGEPWHIGIVNPADPAHHRALVDVHNGSVVTSGIHERSFVHDGVTYHHILSPQTGMPAQSDLASATIVSDRSIDGDGWSTTIFMMGMERGLAQAENLPGVEAVLIDRDDRVRWTSGLDDRLSLIPTLPRL